MIWSLLNNISGTRSTCGPERYTPLSISMPQNNACYPPCLHSISLVQGYSSGYAYWNNTTKTWSFGAITNAITTLNTLTATIQVFAVGTSGTDFNISSSVATHTFNLPTASATNRGALSSTDWSTFNSKESALTFSQPLVRTSNTITLGSLTTFGAANQVLSTNTSAADIEYRTITFGTGSTGNDLNISYSAGSIQLNIPTATSSVRGVLSSTDWTTFNAKIGGSGTNGYAAFFTGASTISSDSNFQWDNTNKRLGVGLTPSFRVDISQTYLGGTASTYRALNVLLSYAGSSYSPQTTYAAYFNNTAGMQSSDVRYGLASIVDPTSAYGNTLGSVGYGVYGYSSNTNSNHGGYFVANGGNVASRSHIGVRALVTTYSASSSTAIAGLFEVNQNAATKTSGVEVNFLYAAATPSVEYLFNGRVNGSTLFSVRSDGKMYVGGSTTPTAWVHIAAGTASASSQPIKLTTGSLLTTEEVGVFEYITPTLYFTNGGGKRQEIPQIQQSRVSTQFDKTDTTLANVTGLTATLVAGKTYHFEATLFIDADATGGSKYAIAGTCTATAIKYQIQLFDNSTNTLTINARQTALAGSSGQASTTAGFVKITGMITVNAAGTLTVQFAQNAANGTSSVLTLSSFKTREIA